eukprot:GILJ01000797.1.p1 GENE.GILJ01000797.1~~GILJ01000797.1.p1  ORF type:complete len:171 (+),score=15.41 GILJ01000797.1:47-514(+)
MVDFQVWIPRVFAFCCAVAVLSALSRPDYNVPLFGFAFFIWRLNNKAEQFKLTVFMLFTFIIDLAWIIYWGPKWTKEGGVTESAKWEDGVHRFSLALSIINLIIKFFLVGLMFVTSRGVEGAAAKPRPQAPSYPGASGLARPSVQQGPYPGSRAL